MGEYLLEVKNLKKTYPIYRNTGKLFGSKERMNAVDGMSFYIKKGETYGLVGESGCGKSTSGRAIVGLTKTDSGSIFYEGTDLCSLSEKEFRPFRKEIQMVFQNTLSAYPPPKDLAPTVKRENPMAVTTEAATTGVMILRQYLARSPRVPSKIPPMSTAPTTAG